jgi:hypothetical protein
VTVAQTDNSEAVIIVRVWHDNGRFRSKIITIREFADPAEAVEYVDSPDELAARIARRVASLVAGIDPGDG